MNPIEKILGLKEFTGWHMFGVMVLFFGTIIGVNVTMAWFATSTWSGLVVKNSYVESQRFNEVTAEKRRQAALGWSAETGYDAGIFFVDMTDDAGDPIRGAIVSAKIGHPVQERDDRTVTLLDRGEGGYAGEVDLDPGIWNADLTVTGPKGEIWTRAIRFLVKE